MESSGACPERPGRCWVTGSWLHTAVWRPASLQLSSRALCRTPLFSSGTSCLSSASRPKRLRTRPRLTLPWKDCSCQPTSIHRSCMLFRVQDITSINLMVALDSTEEGFMKTCTQVFGIDKETDDIAHKRAWAKLHMVWKQAKITCDTELTQ